MSPAVPHGRSVALIGMRGSGKSTVGRELTALWDATLVDTDDIIKRSAGRSIADIFAAEGEAGFRKRERDAVATAVAQAQVPAVISVGGGAILDPENVRNLRGVARIVWLTAPIAVLQGRIDGDPSTSASRPALTQAGEDELRTLLAQRQQAFREAADLTVDTSTRTAREVARIITKWTG